MTLTATDQERMRYDTRWYAQHVRIVDKDADEVTLDPRPAQLKLQAAIDRQRAAGVPVRILVLKSRKTGISTWVEVRALQRCTLIPNQRALVVAQDSSTAGELFGIAEFAYGRLPDWEGFKPPIRNRRNLRELWWGEPSREARERGEAGINSRLRVDTAQEVEAGRGFTYHFLHLSEAAFYGDMRKMVALLNAVPKKPGTEIIFESTANGANHFKARWDRAVRGESDYEPVFIGWLEDPDCWMRLSDEARADFEVGVGPYGEEEPELADVYGASLEQLAWRRSAIANECDGSVETFHQEYPTTPEEAFLASGKTVFDKALVARVVARCKRTDPALPDDENPGPRVGVFEATKTVKSTYKGTTYTVPRDVVWKAKRDAGHGAAHPYWRMWGHPYPGLAKGVDCPRCTAEGGDCDLCHGTMKVVDGRARGAYVVGVDPMSGEETEGGDRAWHGITVIDHRSKDQRAVWWARIDSDLVADEALKAALYWNDALIAVEISGGYGNSIVQRLYHGFGYRNVFRRRTEGQTADPLTKRLGWDTTPATKPVLEDRTRELLRTGADGIRSARLASELRTYVRQNERGRTGPDKDAFADVLMAWQIAQHISTIQHPPSPKSARNVSSITRRPLNALGY